MKIEAPKITQVYSSPFYRCLQTIQPFIDKLGGEMEVRGDNGLGLVVISSLLSSNRNGTSGFDELVAANGTALPGLTTLLRPPLRSSVLCFPLTLPHTRLQSSPHTIPLLSPPNLKLHRHLTPTRPPSSPPPPANLSTNCTTAAPTR